MHVAQKWPNLEKHPPFLQFLWKLSEFFWWKILQIVFFFLCSLAYGSILFLLWFKVWKMDDLIQRPLEATFSILNFPQKNLVRAGIKQLSSKKIEKFWWKLNEHKPYLSPRTKAYQNCSNFFCPSAPAFFCHESLQKLHELLKLQDLYWSLRPESFENIPILFQDYVKMCYNRKNNLIFILSVEVGWLWHQILKTFTGIMAWLFSPKNQPTEPIWATF